MKMLTLSEIEAMARESGAGEIHNGSLVLWQSQFAFFATLVAAKARAEAMEEAAKVCVERAYTLDTLGRRFEAMNCAAAIRAAQKEVG